MNEVRGLQPGDPRCITKQGMLDTFAKDREGVEARQAAGQSIYEQISNFSFRPKGEAAPEEPKDEYDPWSEYDKAVKNGENPDLEDEGPKKDKEKEEKKEEKEEEIRRNDSFELNFI